jgi:hypothetical protein
LVVTLSVLLAMTAIGMPFAAAGAATATATQATPTAGAGAAAVCPGGFCTGRDLRLMRAQLPLDKAVAAIRHPAVLGGRADQLFGRDMYQRLRHPQHLQLLDPLSAHRAPLRPSAERHGQDRAGVVIGPPGGTTPRSTWS